MTEALTIVLIIAAAVGSGLMAGFFFAFSFCVMGALERLPPNEGARAMQVINDVVLNPIFFAAFFGTAALCLALIVVAWLSWHTPVSTLLIAGSLLYLVGSIVVTMVFNVPLNEALKAVQAESAEGMSLWRRYLARWVPWNHVRTFASLGAAVLLTIAACARI
jgi:uncharacterized membrane protein